MKQYYCVSCGRPCDQRIQDCSGIMPDIVLLTCVNSACKVHMQTASPNSLNNGKFATDHKVSVQFDHNTGDKK